MCGIVGKISLNNQEIRRETIELMIEKIKHRGPNGSGILLKGKIGFGHTRLSIIDLSDQGLQPMTFGNYTLIFNGEIYNYLELKKQLRDEGVVFHTETDTEVLLQAYIRWGKNCLDKLNGMFAFAVFDELSGDVFIARDRFGIKPLYYFKTDDELYFASEIPPILSILERDKVIPNEEAIADFLIYNRTDHGVNTFFKGIKRLEHGCYMEVRNCTIRTTRWYDLPSKINTGLTKGEDFGILFNSSIEYRLRSDVPVGVCLSGGLDSSSIAMTIRESFKREDLNTFSAVYGSGVFGDETKFINEFSPLLKNMHYTNPTAKTLLEDLYSFVRAHAEPVPSTSPYAQYKVMELAKRHVVVTLDGQGADEALAGYHYFYGSYFKELLTRVRLFSLIKEAAFYVYHHRSFFAFRALGFFLLPSKWRTKVKINRLGYLNKAKIKEISGADVISTKLYGAKSLKEALINHFHYKLEHLLKWEDRNSMHFAIESRVPFLDHRLVEHTLALPNHKILSKGYTKVVLRNSMKGLLPERIRLRQDKVGFGTPQDDWFREDDVSRLIWKIIRSKSFEKRGFFDVNQVHSKFKKHLNREINIAKEIWKWIHLELWYREFIDYEEKN